MSRMAEIMHKTMSLEALLREQRIPRRKLNKRAEKRGKMAIVVESKMNRLVELIEGGETQWVKKVMRGTQTEYTMTEDVAVQARVSEEE